MDNTTPLLEARGLSKKFGSATALNQLSFTLPRGRIVGLLGPNGSGKTTLIKLACGLIRPSGGSLLINGAAPGLASRAAISYLPDRNYLDEQRRICDVIGMFADFYADFDAAKALDMVRSLGLDAQARIRALSKGMKEKVQLILVMSRNADLYLLDEPIGGVDPAAREFIIHTILTNYNEKSTVLISTHLIAEVEPILDEAIFLREGQIFLSGSVDSLRSEQGRSLDEIFREVFRCWAN